MVSHFFTFSNWNREGIMIVFVSFIVLAAILQQIVGKDILPFVRLMLIIICWNWLVYFISHIGQLLRIG